MTSLATCSRYGRALEFGSNLCFLNDLIPDPLAQDIFCFAYLGDGENSWITDKCPITTTTFRQDPISHQPYITPALYYTGPYYTGPYYTSPYYTGPYYTGVLHCTILPQSILPQFTPVYITPVYYTPPST